jgi:hypothetical protein
MLLDPRRDLVDGDVTAELARERRHVGVVDPARDDPAEPAEVRITVQREPVHGRTTRYPDADSCDLAGRSAASAWHPHPGSAGDLDRVDTELGADRDQSFFEPPHMADRVDGHRQSHDRVAHYLPRAVPGDPPATIDVDHGRAVYRTLEILRATTGRENRRVLKQQAGVGNRIGHPFGVDLALQLPRLVVRHNAEVPELDHDVHDTCSGRSDGGCGQPPTARPGLRWNAGVVEFLLPGYEIEELLGFGGSGEVWRARDEATGDLVALKRLRGTSSTDPVAVQRLRREAALLATIHHDHIVALRSVVPTADGLVLVLEYAAGGSLAAVLAARSRLSAGEVVTIGAPLAQALGDAHARGLVHGDVTPGNVVFDASGKPLLADLGVASLAGDRAGPVAGTFGFADPAGIAGSAAGDVHGLAAVCFTALAGVTPYREGEVVAQQLRTLAPGAPGALVAAITAGLDPDPAARPDANAFARALFAACSPVAVRLVRVTQAVMAPQTHDLVADRLVAPGLGAKADGPPAGRHRWSPGRPVVIRRVVTAACAVALLGAAVAAGVGWAWAGDSHRASASPDADPDGVTPAPISSSSAGPVSSAPVSAGPASASPTVAPAPSDWTGVLAALDSTRDDAFADARPDDLEAVYIPGSSALAADRDTLSQLVKAGEHARGLRLQLVSVRAVSLSPGEVTLAVSDTLGAYDVIGPSGTPEAVAGRGLRTWTVVLESQPATGPWRIASITAA